MADIFDIGIRISMLNAAGPVLANIIGQFTTLDRHATGLIARFNQLGRAQQFAVAGAASIATGGAILTTLEKMEKHGENIIQAQAVFGAGLNKNLTAAQKQQEIAKATAAAWKESGDNLQTSATENIKAITDLYNVFQKTDVARDMLPVWNRMRTTAANVATTGGNPDTASDNSVLNFMRALERRHGGDEHAIVGEMEALNRMIIATGGRITGSKFNSELAASAGAGVFWNSDYATTAFPGLIYAMGTGAGHAMNQAYQNLYGGRTSSVMQDQFQIEYGLHTSADYLDPKHKKPGFVPGSGFKASLYQSDPLEWGGEFIKQLQGRQVNGHTIDTNNKQDMQDVIMRIARGNTNVQRALEEILLPQQRAQQIRERDKIRNVGGDAGKQLQDDSPQAARDAVTKQMDNALTAIGQSLVKPMTDNILKPLASALNEVAQFAQKNPELIANITKGFAALGVALVALGAALAVASLAFVGPGGAIVAGIAGIGAALYLFWDKIKAWNPALIDGIVQAGGKFWNALKGWAGGLTSIVTGLVTLDPKKFEEGFKQLAQSYIDFAKNVGQLGITIGAALIKAAQDLAPAVANFATTIASDMSSAIRGIASMVMDAIGEMAKSIGTAIFNAIASINPFGGVSPGTAAAANEALDIQQKQFSAPGEAPHLRPRPRAFGGHAAHGLSYLVGEDGPELFIPSTNGNVVSNSQLRNPAPPRGNQVAEIHNVMTLDGEVVHRSVERRMVKSLTHPTSAPYFDGSRNWSSSAMQFSTG